MLPSSLLPDSLLLTQESRWEIPKGSGQFEITQYPSIPYRHFTLLQLVNGSISYQHNYSAGLDPVPITVTISNQLFYVLALPFEGNITLSNASCLPVAEGTTKLLLPRHIHATTDFTSQNSVLTYRVTAPLLHGYLEVYEPNRGWVRSDQRSPRPGIVNFTQTEIDMGHVRYYSIASVPSGSLMLLDSFQFQVFSSQLPGPEGSFCIRVLSRVKPSLVVATANVSVPEGGEVVLGRSIISLSFSPDLHELQQLWEEPITPELFEVEVLVASQPEHGKLMLLGSELSGGVIPFAFFLNNSVTYLHDDSENFLDQIDFRVRVTSVRSYPLLLPDQSSLSTLWINIQPLNDNHPVLSQPVPIRVTEGSYVILNSSMLRVSDHDQDADLAYINIIITSQSSGHFANIEMIDEPIIQFRYIEIMRKKIIFHSTINKDGPLQLRVRVLIQDGVHDENQVGWHIFVQSYFIVCTLLT